MPPERGGRRNAKPPLKFSFSSADGHVCRLKVRRDMSNSFVINRAVLGERHSLHPKLGHPSSAIAVRKAPTPAVRWLVFDADTELVAFTPNKIKAANRAASKKK